MNPTYILKRYRLGWILCGNQNYTGIPLNALNECKGLFEPGALIHPGILHHIKMVHDNTAVFALATKANGDKWIEEISNSIQILPSQEKWWVGLDVGRSSAVLFSVFCEPHLAIKAAEFGCKDYPRNAANFGQCARLLAIFPEWRNRLVEVSEKYSDTKWPVIIQKWDELEASDPDKQTEFLRNLF